MIQALQDRTRQWWKAKAGNILAMVFLASLVHQFSFFEAIVWLPLAIATILGIGVFGHFINDWADRATDRAAGKTNFFANRSPAFFVLCVLLSLFVALAPWWWLPYDQFTMALLGSEFALLLFYPLPPFRLKTRGIWALIADGLYAHALPAVLAYHTFSLIHNHHAGPDVAIYTVIGVWQFLVGLYNVAIHQFEDYDNDRKAGIKTWVLSIGKEAARKYTLHVFYFPQIAMFFLFICLVAIRFLPFYFTFPLLYVLLKLHFTFQLKKLPFVMRSPHTADFQFLNINYHHFLPYWHMFLISLQDPMFLLILLGYAVLFDTYWFKWIFLKKTFLFRILSVVANYGIFYFRIIVLGESPSKARRAYQQAYQQRREDYIKRLHSHNIVMANSTLTKYTETYVALHKKYLTDAGFYLHLFYGGHLPTSEKQHGLFLPDDSCSKGLRLMKQCLFHFPDELHYQKTAIKKYLLANNIKLVLGEFGLVSAEMAPICKALNIPLIAIFYGGYDIHNKKVLEQAKDKYQLLFNYASCIIGVSKEITGILKNLGADEQKIFYLPCAVDLDKFAYTDHSVNQPVFLSVGRFAETKSPHLTILAFHEVLKKVPDAQLRMIGKDGGGELFEACHILVKALKIEDKVTFLGIRSTDEVYEEMKKARVFVQHSLTTPITGEKEGTPVAVMEAMACGLPVVATRHAGIAELIEHGQTGMLVDEYDYMAMAEKMAEVCLSDRLVFEIGKNAAISIRSNERIARHKEILIDLVNKYILQ